MPVQWSHSRLQNFEQCPRRFYHEAILKDCKQETIHPTTLWGQQVHKAIELRINEGTPLPDNMVQYAQQAEMAASLPSVKAEVQFAITTSWTQTDWFSADVWGRAILDVLSFLPDGNTAYIGDWKLGKYRGDTGQARVNAFMLMATNPDIKTVHTQFIYLAANKVDTQTFTRDKLPQYVEPTLETIRRIEVCNDNGEWPATPSGLCAYCPVTRCQFNRSKRTKP